MDYKKLADLLYPNAQDPEVWENKFPPRNLKEGAEVTRFAPSPTGYLHIGHFFQCLCDSFISKSTGGVFYFRVEDTDKKREVDDSIDVAIDTLAKFGVSYDEGIFKGGKEVGAYGPYLQSKRTEIYNSFAKKLVQNGRAYPCFCQKAENFEEIKEKRQEQLQENDNLEQKDACRNLSFEEVETNIKAGKPFALRLKSFGDPENVFVFKDVVKGERKIRQNSKDIILIKSNGLPVYAFAHAVDDHLMRTTLVVRGEEWFPSLSAHLELFDALEFPRVKYAHNPVISKIDADGGKRKISKRKDAEADMRYFVREGYPVNAIKEYLLNLANSNFEIWRKNNPDTSLEDFDFKAEKITQSNPMFDFAKLNDISKTIISKMTKTQVFELLDVWSSEFDKEFNAIINKDKNYTLEVLNIDREKPKPRKDIAKMQDVKQVWGYMFDEYFSPTYQVDDKNIADLKLVVQNYAKIYAHDVDKETWFAQIKEMSSSLGFAVDNKEYKANPEKFKGNVATVCEYIRVALTGLKDSPDLYSICQVLGQDTVKKRFTKALCEL